MFFTKNLRLVCFNFMNSLQSGGHVSAAKRTVLNTIIYIHFCYSHTGSLTHPQTTFVRLPNWTCPNVKIVLQYSHEIVSKITQHCSFLRELHCWYYIRKISGNIYTRIRYVRFIYKFQNAPSDGIELPGC